MAKKKTKPAEAPSGTAEDTELWRHVVRDAIPMRDDRISFSDLGGAPAKKRKDNGDMSGFSREIKITPSAIAYRQALTTSIRTKGNHPEISVTANKGTVAGLDKRSSERLRKGQMVIEGKVDLHGMTQKQAHSRLSGFIRASHAAGKRCVLVVTGKGKTRAENDEHVAFMTPGPKGILRAAVPQWLHEPDLRPFIVDVRPARPQHGGDGALYVLLRRRRLTDRPSQ